MVIIHLLTMYGPQTMKFFGESVRKGFKAAVHTTNYNNANFSQISVCPRLPNDDNV